MADKLGKVVKLNDNIKLPIKNLSALTSKANDIQKLIADPKGAAMNFVYGKLASIKASAISAVRSIFRF